MDEQQTKFMTIRQTAKTGILPESRLRLMQKQNRLPGIQSGNRFLVNVGLLMEDLQAASRQAQNRVGG